MQKRADTKRMKDAAADPASQSSQPLSKTQRKAQASALRAAQPGALQSLQSKNNNSAKVASVRRQAIAYSRIASM